MSRILWLSADRGVDPVVPKGASANLRHTVRAFRQLGHEVLVLTPAVADPDDLGCKVARIGTPEVVFAQAHLVPLRPAEPLAAPAPSSEPLRAPPYQPDKLFHGPSWRVLEGILTSPEGAEGTVRSSRDLPRPAEVVDAAYQLACAWADDTHGFMALPVGAATLTWYGPADGPLRLTLTPRAEGDRILADLIGQDAEGQVCVMACELELQRATTRVRP